MENVNDEAYISALQENYEHNRYSIDCLSRIYWISDYARDIFVTMKKSELQRLPLLFISQQLDQRPRMLELCHQIITKFHLSRCTFHLTTYFLDRLLDQFTILEDKLFLVAIVCVHTAAQMENIVLIPRFSELNSMVEQEYTLFEFKVVERKVLTYFDFQLLRPTTASFVELFARNIITPVDFAAYNAMINSDDPLAFLYTRYESFDQMLAALAQLLLEMSDYTLNIVRFGNEPPSLLAASCIGAVRQISNIPQLWTPYLTQLTSYTQDMVQSTVDIITIYHYYHSANLNQPLPEKLMTDSHENYEVRYVQDWCSPDSGFGDRLDVTQQIVVAEQYTNIAYAEEQPAEEPNAEKPPSSTNKRKICNFDYPNLYLDYKRFKFDNEETGL